MRNSYIAKDAEALNLHNGSQTAIVLAMKVQPTPNKFNPQNVDYRMTKGKNYCAGTNHSIESLNDSFFGILDCSPYALGQEVYVRESWIYRHKHDKYYYKADHSEFEPYCHKGWKSPATMPKSAARTRFKIVSCEAVRVNDDIGHNNAIKLLEFDYSEGQQFKNYSPDWNKYDDNQLQFGDYRDSWQSYIISRFGQTAWDENHFIWYYKIEKI